MRWIVFVLIVVLAGCVEAEDPAATDDVALPADPDPVLDEIRFSTSGSFGMAYCLDTGCVTMNQRHADPVTLEDNQTLAGLDLRLDGQGEATWRIECHDVAGRACAGAKVLFEETATMPIQATLEEVPAGLQGVRLLFSVERSVPMPSAEGLTGGDDYTIGGTVAVKTA